MLTTNQSFASEWIFEDQLLVRIRERCAPNNRNRRHEITPCVIEGRVFYNKRMAVVTLKEAVSTKGKCDVTKCLC